MNHQVNKLFKKALVKACSEAEFTMQKMRNFNENDWISIFDLLTSMIKQQQVAHVSSL